MNAVLFYGKVISRAFLSTVSSEAKTLPKRQLDLKLLAASSGYAKTLTRSQLLGHFNAVAISRWKYGDDACFIAKNDLADVIGVADGVGGWHSYGIDPSHFSCTLMHNCARIVEESERLQHIEKVQEPQSILSQAYQDLLEEKATLIGSATACIMSLSRKDGCLSTVNLGDSGYVVVRQGKIVARSEALLHYFNTPFQLSNVPPTQEGQAIKDDPELSLTSAISVENGDIIVLATDGLFDNMHEDMILEHLSKLKTFNVENVQRVANSLASTARRLAFDPDYMSPFAVEAKEAGLDICGGKPDDVTVVVAVVLPIECEESGELIASAASSKNSTDSKESRGLNDGDSS